MNGIKIIFLTLFLLFKSILFSQNIKINEVSSSAMAFLDDAGKPSDWIELYNPNSGPLLLSDYYLSDDINELQKFQLPPFILPANSFILIYADGKNRIDSTIHTNFQLAKKGDSLFISSAQSSVIDFIIIPELQIDVSYGRSINGAGTWVYFQNPTPKQSNLLSTYFTCLLKKPIIQTPAGLYSNSQQVVVTNPNPQGTIRYTTNGTEPTLSSSIYSTPVTIDNINFPNGLSTVPTNPSFNYPIGSYTEVRAHTRGWLPPYSDVNNISILKVKTFHSGCLSSETNGASYLINQPHNYPVVSIIMDSLALFDATSGIYHYGNDLEPNYDADGFASERKVLMEYFDENGNLVFSEDLGLRIAGNGSRHSAVKNLKLYMRDQYGNGKIREQLFHDENLAVFETLLLRSGGHRPDCMPKDEVGSRITEVLPFEKSKFVQVIVYINGEYWGIHSLKQKLDEDHLHNKYDIPKNEVVLLYGRKTVNHGIAQDEFHYTDMVNYAFTNDLNDPLHYQHIDSLVDLNNYRDYMISQIFLGNGDWPYSNIKFWRKRAPINSQSSLGHDGKYRWILYDLDGTFGGSCSNTFVTFNTLNQAMSPNAPFTEYTYLFRGLLAADVFKTDYINRTCDLLNSSFLPIVTREKLSVIKQSLDDQVLDHVVRWRYPSIADSLQHRQNEVPNLQKWEFLTHRMDTFLIERPRYARNHMKAAWGLGDTSKISIDVNDQIMGKVKINSILLDAHLEGVTASVYPWQGTYFQYINIPLKAIPNPGYRFVHWLETGNTQEEILISISGDTNFTAIFEIDPNYIAPLPLFINEFMSGNKDYMQDEFGEYDDWLEIYNPNNFPIDLSTYTLTDNLTQPQKYSIDIPLFIPANGFAVFWCDNQTGQGIYHTNFSLNNTVGEFIGLYNKTTQQYEDSLLFTPVPQNHSYGRESDGSATWIYFDQPTPNASNQTTSIIEFTTNSFYVYPNPNATKTLYSSTKITGAIYSITGKIVGTINNSQTISIANLTSGVYFIKTVDGGVVKFVVI